MAANAFRENRTSKDPFADCILRDYNVMRYLVLDIDLMDDNYKAAFLDTFVRRKTLQFFLIPHRDLVLQYEECKAHSLLLILSCTSWTAALALE